MSDHLTTATVLTFPNKGGTGFRRKRDLASDTLGWANLAVIHGDKRDANEREPDLLAGCVRTPELLLVMAIIRSLTKRQRENVWRRVVGVFQVSPGHVEHKAFDIALRLSAAADRPGGL